MTKILFIGTLEQPSIIDAVNFIHSYNNRATLEELFEEHLGSGLSKVLEKNSWTMADLIVEATNAINSNTLDNFFHQVFDHIYDDLIAAFVAQEFDASPELTPYILQIGHIDTKPAGIDYVIGYAAKDSEVDIYHLMDHEEFSESLASSIINGHNAILRANRDEFDYFFDGNEGVTIEQLIEELKALA